MEGEGGARPCWRPGGAPQLEGSLPSPARLVLPPAEERLRLFATCSPRKALLLRASAARQVGSVRLRGGEFPSDFLARLLCWKVLPLPPTRTARSCFGLKPPGQQLIFLPRRHFSASVIRWKGWQLWRGAVLGRNALGIGFQSCPLPFNPPRGFLHALPFAG